jgi:hypothetical protein
MRYRSIPFDGNSNHMLIILQKFIESQFEFGLIVGLFNVPNSLFPISKLQNLSLDVDGFVNVHNRNILNK